MPESRRAPPTDALATNPAPDRPGRVVDPLAGTPYRGMMPLGSGGMGEVLEALHVELDRLVVVKLLHQSLASEPKLVDRLRVEARTLATLAHPHIVSVSDFGRTPGGRPYFVMERLQGRTLRQVMEARGALPVGEAIEYVRQVLCALSAAHQLGIIHRDVKADNVFLCIHDHTRPFVKLLDFGIAKILGGAGRQHAPVPQYPTAEGILLGTPRSLAPEQALCKPVDARTDIYAVGILLYTLVAGVGPFPRARDQQELITAHVEEVPPPPSRVARQPIPDELERAILRALAKRPEDRFQAAEEFEAELGRIAARLSEPAAPLTTETSSSEPTVTPARAAAPCDDDAPTMATGRAAGNAPTMLERPMPRGAAAPLAKRMLLFAAATVASTTFFCAALALLLRFFGGH
jgi:serine/threonine protein kinase